MPDDQNNLSGEQLDKWNYIDRIKREFSIYGASISDSGDPWGEACAEAYAEVMTKGSQSREFSRKIFAKMIELYLERQKVKGDNDV